MQNQRLIKKTLLYFLGNFSSRIFSVLLIPIFAFYIVPEELGVYDFLITIMNVTTPIILVAIWEAVLKFLLSNTDKEEQSKLISTTFIFTFSMILIYFIIILLLKNLNLINFSNYFSLYFMTISYGLSTFYQYFSRGLGHNKLFVFSSIISTFIRFLTVVIFVIILKWGFNGLVVSYVSGTISNIIIIESRLNLLNHVKIRLFDRNLLGRILRFSFPLVFNLISAWFISGFGRIIITSRLGSDINGQYSFATNFSQIFIAIGSVVTMALIEEAILSIQTSTDNHQLNKSINQITDLLFYLAIYSVPIIVIVYKLFAKTDYSTSIYLVFPLILYAVINNSASNIGSLFQASGNTSYLFSTTMFGGLATLVISFAFIEYLGVFAVIVGQVIGAYIMLLTRLKLIKKFLTFNFNWGSFTLYAFIFLMLSLVLLNSNIIFVFVIAILLTLVYIYMSKDVLNSIINKLKEKSND